MLQFLLNLFSSPTWEPHGYSFEWSQPLLTVLTISNVLIGLTFLLTGIVLIHLIRRRADLEHRQMFILFGIFILGCGLGYFVRLWALYEPVYRLQGWVDALTAAASIGTALLLLPILPSVYRLPSPSQLHSVNAQLDHEIQIRRQAELDLQQTTEVLEFRVQERTVELEQMNTALKAQIDERLQVENALMLAHESADQEGRRLKAVLDALPVGVFITDASGAIVETNEAARRVWGGDAPLAKHAEEYHIYKGWSASTGEPLQASAWGLARALKGETSVGELVEIERFDGSRGIIVNSAAPILTADGALAGAVAVSVDVTAQQMAEEALRGSEARLSGIIDSAMDAIISVDEDERIILFNDAAESIFGIPVQEAMGKPLSDFIPLRYRDAHHRHLAHFRETGKTHRSMKDPPVVPALRADGSEFPIEATISQVMVSGQRIFTVILRDVTPQMKAQQAREELLALEQQARIAAEEASALKSEFLGMVSHELRTPLTSIMGFASTLLAEDVSFEPEVQRDFINIINLESGKLKDLVEQLLDVTRIQAKTLRIQPRPQPLENVIEIASPQLETLVDARQLEFKIPDDLPHVDADEKRVSQVIVNLVDNAVKFSAEGTHITVSAEANGDDEVQIAVTDEGIGIPPEQREWVFEPFRQVGEQFTSRGAGLGLAICKGLVEAHGGRIWIENGNQRGTTVKFTLPTAD